MVQKSILLIIFILIPAILFCQETTPLPEVTTSIEEPTPFQEETDALEDGTTPVPEEKAEDMPALPEDKEAEEAIFDFTIGDAEVDFFLTGSWTFTFFAATGILITPEGGVQYLDSFPSFTDGFYFKQIPDLTLSVRILEKYFIDITYRGEEEKENLFLAGYEGGEDELLRHLYIGNTDINLSPSPYLEIPESGNSSLGTHALLNTPASTHELLLRYDYNTDGKKIYKGKNEVVEIRYSPEEYKRGYYFKLPDADI